MYFSSISSLLDAIPAPDETARAAALAHWDKFAAATPAGRRGVVTGRYVFFLLTLAASAVVLAVGAALLARGFYKRRMPSKIAGAVLAVTGLLALLGLWGVPYLEVGVPGVLSLYFDVFSGGVQALVFSLLTMVYIGNACPAPEDGAAPEQETAAERPHTS